MKSYFDEVADMMANSRSVGPYNDRATIMAALRRRFASEGELREFVTRYFAMANALIAAEELDFQPIPREKGH